MNMIIFKNKFFPLRASLIRPFAALPGVRGMHIYSFTPEALQMNESDL